MAMRTSRATSRTRPGSRSTAKRPARTAGRGHSQRAPGGKAPRAASTAPEDKTSSKGGRATLGPEMAAQKKAWEERYSQAKERPDLYPLTISGIPIQPLYTPEDLA